MRIVPANQKDAFAYINSHHRHLSAPTGWKFGIFGVHDNGDVFGLVCVGRPVARHLDDGFTLEVNRLCTDGTKNACSFLYASSWKAAKALGYRKLITYILESEPGTSLRASGWKEIGCRGGGFWDVPSRPRHSSLPSCKKTMFQMEI